jgi:hypothetical protein
MIIAGAGLVVFGALFWALARTTNFGRLPGDISFSGESVSVYIPIASMLIASVILTIVLNVVVRLLR